MNGEYKVVKMSESTLVSHSQVESWFNKMEEDEAEIAKLKVTMRVLAKCADEDITKLKALMLEAASLFQHTFTLSYPDDIDYGEMLRMSKRLNKAAKQ